MGKGELQKEGAFDMNEKGVAEFSTYAAGAPGSLFYVLADVVEEDFFQENVPYVRGADRRRQERHRGVPGGGTFPPLVVRMLRVGESTGALDKALLNVSYFYNREVRESIGKIQVIIEPALTVLLGVILGWVMLSVLGPIYDVISKIKV